MRTIFCAFIGLVVAAFAADSNHGRQRVIVVPKYADSMLELASKQLRRSIFLSTGRFAEEYPLIVNEADFSQSGVPSSSDNDVIRLSVDPSLVGDETWKITKLTDGSGMEISGATSRAVLHGILSFCEQAFGVSYGLDGDQFPPRGSPRSEKARQTRITNLMEEQSSSPAFAIRGLQPFHDFLSGPDGWDEDEHKRIVERIAMMKGNAIMFHTYPLQEPAVWVGLEDQFDPASGNVTVSYNTSWCNTERPGWGYTPMSTGDFAFGADQLWERDCDGSPLQDSEALCPYPQTDSDANELFNRAGALWNKVFSFAKEVVGVKTGLGNEAPLATPPPAAQEMMPFRLYWSEARKDSFVTQTACEECEDLYVLDGVEGIGYSEIPNGANPDDFVELYQYFNGHDNWLTTGPEPGYDLVRSAGFVRKTAANSSFVPLVTYYKASIGDHRAVAGWPGVRNATAGGYVANVTLGYVLNSSALPVTPSHEDYFVGIFKRIMATHPMDWYSLWTPEQTEWNKINSSSPIIQQTAQDILAAQSAWEKVKPDFSLATCGWVLGPIDNRSFFAGVAPDSWWMSTLESDLGRTPVDPAFANVSKTHFTIDIPWLEDDPGLTAPELWLGRDVEQADAAQKMNVGGVLGIHWRTRATSPQAGALLARAWTANTTAASYWALWTQAQFDPGHTNASLAAEAARLFEMVDSWSAPRPVNWLGGPGGMQADGSQCSLAATNYSFVDPFCALVPHVSDPDANERISYWCNSFLYWRQIAITECDWASYDSLYSTVSKMPAGPQRIQAAKTTLFPAMTSLIQNATKMMNYQLASTTTYGERGIGGNLLTHSMPKLFYTPLQQLAALANVSQLPPQCQLPTQWTAPPQLKVPTVRSILQANEPLRLTAWAPAAQPVSEVTLHYRTANTSNWNTLPFQHASRAVWKTQLKPQLHDFEWYVSTSNLYFPPAGPQAPQYVIVH